MAHSYLNQLRFSHLEDLRPVAATLHYDVGSPSTDFEAQVQGALAEARTHHLQDELGLALDGYRQLQALILKTVDPTLPTGSSRHPAWQTLVTGDLLDALLSTTAATLARTPVALPDLPDEVTSPDPVPAAVGEALAPFVALGTTTGSVAQVGVLVQRAAAAVAEQDFASAADLYTKALSAAGDDSELAGYLTHDLGLVTVRAGDLAKGAGLLQRAVDTFATLKVADGQVAALGALADVQRRQGQSDDAAKTIDEADKLAQTSGLGAITAVPARAVATTLLGRAGASELGVAARVGGRVAPVARAGDGAALPPLAAAPADLAAAPATEGGNPGALLALSFLDRVSASGSLALLTSGAEPIEVKLDADRVQNLTGLYDRLKVTDDLSLVQIQRLPAPVFSAYIPYVYFFVLPMSIGDCLAAMGDYAGAETEYLAATKYRFLNADFEVTKVWTRLAENYLAQADTAYRAAGDDAAAIAAAATAYASVVAADGTVPAASPLYADVFAPFVARVDAVLAAAAPVALDENPQVIRLIVQARLRQQQIAAGLNFFGFPPSYVPPFSFTYLQNAARYFAQHAATLEQSYIQFKSQAENEEFRLDQIEQQVELAKASVDLESRGVAEAQAAVAVAQAGVRYADQQRANAQTAKTNFDNTRWEVLELSSLEAWANAAAQDQDDEVHQTISGYTYYNVSDTRRSLVVQDLERRRTLIAQDNEAARLAGEVAAATAYSAVAAAQLQQAQVSVATAQQRVVVAQLQQRQAEESRDFLDMKEFGARLWYELARTMKGLVGTYLDAAIQIAALMERAYATETGRELHKIRFDYRNVATDNLLGADTLLRDIDFFTLDRITTTRTKKAPLKVVVSLADLYPSAFAALVATGTATFGTTLEQFDRMYPGFYLHKIRNVELVLVGVSNGSGIHGTLRNIGVSTFRDQTGAVRDLVYPADVMPLSDFDVRQDIVIFRPADDELRLFENNGLATMWRLDLPLGVNETDIGALIDVQLVLSFDAFYDEDLAESIRVGLPATGTAAKVTSLAVSAPDELFYLRQQGTGVVPLSPADLPRTQKDRARTSATLRLTGPAALVGGLVLTVTPEGGAPLTVTTDADGSVAGSTAADPLGALLGGDPATSLTVAAAAADNPGRPTRGDAVDLADLTDLQLLQEYTFTYR